MDRVMYRVGWRCSLTGLSLRQVVGRVDEINYVAGKTLETMAEDDIRWMTGKEEK